MIKFQHIYIYIYTIRCFLFMLNNVRVCGCLQAMLGASNSSELFGDDSAGNVVGSDNDAVAGAFKILKVFL